MPSWPAEAEAFGEHGRQILRADALRLQAAIRQAMAQFIAKQSKAAAIRLPVGSASWTSSTALNVACNGSTLVCGEIARGTPPRRAEVLADLALLATLRLTTLDEVIEFIERERLHGLGCGLVDLTLLASVLLTPGVTLWTLDRRLLGLAERFGVAWQPKRH